MKDFRRNCPMRHENGNCTVAGGFCTAVNDPICEALHNAYDSGCWDAAIRKRGEDQQWISVSERLPCPNERVLCLCNNRGTNGVIIIGYRMVSGGWARGVNGVVTHWMPLPEPPKEGTI